MEEFWRNGEGEGELETEDGDGMEMELVFEVEEIDLDYEFEAARFFDFTRQESLAEANEAELWFECAKSYPPSSFVVKLLMREDFLLENVNYLIAKEVKNSDDLLKNNRVPEYFAVDVDSKVLESCNNKAGHELRSKTKSNVKPFPRSSTLMKPTASLLAKQNSGPQVGSSSGEKSSCNSSAFESQAAKRQKLEGGHLRKAGDMNHHAKFIHKLPKKVGTLDANSTHVKLKPTIPREPNLETAHRAQRIRPKNSTGMKDKTSTACKFRARPLNRKILEAPSLPIPEKSNPKLPEFQEFHLKTLERAMKHTPAVSSSSILCSDSDKALPKASTTSGAENGNKIFRRSSTTDTTKHDQAFHNFKALHHNKKLYSSKGDVGVFQNVKRENTVTVELNFHKDQGIQHNLPIELFSKLSITSDLLPNDGSKLKMHHPTCITIKGLKGNKLNPFQHEDGIEKENFPYSRVSRVNMGVLGA